ncbi:MAG: hypothetical protein HY738_06000, partial [Bacteroidia bacterium]|nr:hypothetical protein [Bacteroidia bacterium]
MYIIINNDTNYIYCLCSSRKIPFQYNVKYDNFSLYYYDLAGRPVTSVSPKFTRKLTVGNHISTNSVTYNKMGLTASAFTSDQGTTSFRYFDDGRIRFSQNAKQATLGNFSYTEYDAYNRIIRTGECTLTNAFLTWNLNTTIPETYSTNTTYFVYDIPYQDGLNSALGTTNHNFKQRFLAGRVSRTMNDNATTWYSY